MNCLMRSLIATVVLVMLWCCPARADISGTCRIDNVMSAGCGGNLCSVFVSGSVNASVCPMYGYHWDPVVAILYYDSPSGQWLFCGYAFIQGAGCSGPLSGQTSTIFHTGQSYLFRLVATIDHNDGTPAVICISLPSYIYTIPGS